MIISHKHQFIFVHLPKTAGSSATVYLSSYLGWRDVQIGVIADCLKAGIWPSFRTSLDFLHPKVISSALPSLCRGDLPSAASAQRHRYSRFPKMRVHASAYAIKEAHPREWASYLTFCFVRNPWARMASLYLWRQRQQRSVLEFRQFLKSFSVDDPNVGWPFYTIKGRIAVNYVGYFETLREDMAALCERIGIPFDPETFPIMRKGPRYDYRDYYGPEERQIVERLCAREIEAFGYEF